MFKEFLEYKFVKGTVTVTKFGDSVMYLTRDNIEEY